MIVRALRQGAPGLLSFLLLISLLLAGCGTDREGVTVYAPASLTDVLEAAAAAYHDSTGVTVEIRTGGSGLMAKEVERGAPADIFVSANMEWHDYLDGRNLLVGSTSRLLAWNRLVVVVPSNATETPLTAPTLAKLGKIAVGDPDSVPAGAYTRQSLKALGVWEKLEGKRVETHNVRAALALAERGEVSAAVVYATDAVQSSHVRFAFDLPPTSHDPIVYPAAVVQHAHDPDQARRFLEYLSGPRGRALFADRGFAGAS